MTLISSTGFSTIVTFTEMQCLLISKLTNRSPRCNSVKSLGPSLQTCHPKADASFRCAPMRLDQQGLPRDSVGLTTSAQLKGGSLRLEGALESQLGCSQRRPMSGWMTQSLLGHPWTWKTRLTTHEEPGGIWVTWRELSGYSHQAILSQLKSHRHLKSTKRYRLSPSLARSWTSAIGCWWPKLFFRNRLSHHRVPVTGSRAGEWV